MSNDLTKIEPRLFYKKFSLKMILVHFRELVEKVGARLTTVEDAIKSSSQNIVVLAVPKDFYEKQPLHLLEGKIVIDVSNRNSIYRKGDERSQAEYLQSLLPRSAVVKVSFFKTLGDSFC